MTFWEQIFLSATELHIFGFLLRGIIAFIFLIIIVRLMGPVEVGEITTIDFVVAITIGSIASAALVDSQVHFGSSLLNMALWGFLSITLNYLGIRVPNIRRVIVGSPLVIIKNGKIREKNLFRAKLNFDDLMSALRLKGIALLEDVEFAVLEPNGEISVIKKSQKESITPEDLKMVVEQQGYPAIVVLHGKIMRRNLQHRGYSENWLKEKLSEMGIENPEAVALAQLDTNGKLYIDLYDDKKPRPQSVKEKELIIQLQKVNAQMGKYALEAENEEMKKMYQDYVEQTAGILSALKPKLLKAEDLHN